MGCSIGELLVTQRADLLRACQERLLYLDFYARLSYAEVFGSFTFLWQKRKILQTRKCSCTTLALDAMTGQYILWCYHFICQIVILVLQKLLPWLMKLCIQKIKEQSENSLQNPKEFGIFFKTQKMSLGYLLLLKGSRGESMPFSFPGSSVFFAKVYRIRLLCCCCTKVVLLFQQQQCHQISWP